MSNICTLQCASITKILSHLRNFIPKGDVSFNLTIKVKDAVLYFITKGVAQYKAALGKVECPDSLLTVRYHDISTLISNTDVLIFEFLPHSVTLKTQQVFVTFEAAFDFEDLDFETLPYEQLNTIEDETTFSSLQTFLQTGTLFNVYKKEWPYFIYNGVIVLKTPSIWIQGRCKELNLNSIIASDMLRLLVQIHPKYYYYYSNQLYIAGSNYVCIIPLQPTPEPNNFLTIMQGLSAPVTFNTENLLDTISSTVKLKPNFSTFSIYENGVQFKVALPEFNICKNIGQCDKPKHVSNIPVEILQLVFRLFKRNNIVQVLYKEDILCFRNQTLIIVIRAMR